MMKQMSNQFFLYSLTSLAVTASSLAYAQEDAQAPSLEGGITASIGTFYAAPVAGDQDYVTIFEHHDNGAVDEQKHAVNADYDFGFEAALAYVFDETANSVELSYRTLDADGDGSEEDSISEVFSSVTNEFYDSASSSIAYDFNAVDLMFNQFLDIGTHVQVRFGAGVSYADIEKNQTSTFFDKVSSSPSANDQVQNHSEFSGVGPRVGIDGRYDFGENLAGFGIVAGGSLAYYVGDLDVNETIISNLDLPNEIINNYSEELDNHGVTNLRANIGIDYVYFFEDEASTLGVELGYLIDDYEDAVGTFFFTSDVVYSTELSSFSYSGPYVNLKGVF